MRIPRKIVQILKRQAVHAETFERLNALQEKTIRDFGEQWQAYQSNDGYYSSKEYFSDIVSPYLDLEELKGKVVAEIGSGTGRIVRMLLDSGVSHVVAIEPSTAFDVLVQNTRDVSSQIRYLNATGDQLTDVATFDYIFSIGVLHHIVDPSPVMAAAVRALKPGGRIFVWLYGKENNVCYLTVILPLRQLTKRLPHKILAVFVRVIDILLFAYMRLCAHFPLPLRRYMNEVLRKLSPDKRRLVIYDQLNPAYAKYYLMSEAIKLFSQHGLVDIQVYHRHGYSWSVIGTKPI